MFGARIDYLLLKPLAHSRNRATEEELDREGCSSLTVEQMAGKLETVLQRFDGHFPISPDLRYLDMGCGSGELTLGLARLGARRITGVDFLPRFIHKARDNARAANLPSVEFVCADLHDWRPAQPFDVVISFDALEHIDRPKEFLATMSRFLAPGGIAAISFGPLFHSPFGDHMYEFFKLQIPWRGALFSEQGWRFQYLRTNTFLKSGPLRKLSERVCKTPVLQDYFVHNVYAVMQRAEARQSSIDTRADDLPLAA
jgi:ubiquinone/menaquinone biosynthesis C-methylase UbiE